MSSGNKVVALVTGANKGIGKEIAKGLATRGVHVLLGARNEELGKKAAQDLAPSGDVDFLWLDVSNPESVNQAKRLIAEQYGRLDILVNNAGIAFTCGAKLGSAPKPSQLTPEHLRGVYETNVFAVVSVTNAMLPLLQIAPQGRIVNVSSTRGSFTAPGSMGGVPYLPYSTSKAALNAVTVHYAKEFADAGSGLKINAVCPGFCGTDFNNFRGPKSAADGARIAVEMAMIAADGPSGGFFSDKGIVPW